MSKLKVRSSRTVFTVENERGEDSGTVIVSRTRHRVNVKPANPVKAEKRPWNPYEGRIENEPVHTEPHEYTDNFQTVRVVGLPFKAQVYGDEISPSEAATEGLVEIRETLESHLKVLNSLT